MKEQLYFKFGNLFLIFWIYTNHNILIYLIILDLCKFKNMNEMLKLYIIFLKFIDLLMERNFEMRDLLIIL